MLCSDTGSKVCFGLCDCVQVDEEREEEVGCLLKLGLEQCSNEEPVVVFIICISYL